jgi:hypothetical protein
MVAMLWLIRFRRKISCLWANGKLRRKIVLATGALILLAGSATGSRLLGQESTTNAPNRTKQPAERKSAKQQTNQPAIQAVPFAPVPPPAPAWPINEAPGQAHVTWDSHGLKIEASNSSLDQILHEVSGDTGVKVEGFNKDERIFGTYGPGPAREVLSSLLDGSAYNVLIIGGTGNAPPSRLVLSTSTPASQQVNTPQNNNQAAEEEEPEEPPQPEQPVFQPPQPPQQPQFQAPQQPQPGQQPGQGPQPSPIPNPFGGFPRGPMQLPQPPDQQNNQQQQQQPPQ